MLIHRVLCVNAECYNNVATSHHICKHHAQGARIDIHVPLRTVDRMWPSSTATVFLLRRNGLNLHAIRLDDIAGNVAIVIQNQQLTSVRIRQSLNQCEQLAICRQSCIARVGICNYSWSLPSGQNPNKP